MDPKAQQLYNEIQSLLNMAFARVNDLSTLYNAQSERLKELEARLNGQGTAEEPETDKLLTTPDSAGTGAREE